MIEAFADSAYWLAILNERDAYHEKTTRLPRPQRIVTTWAVLLEVMDALSAPPHRGPAAAFWDALGHDPGVVILPLDEQLLDRAVQLFRKRPDKHWTLTDCISFVVMQERALTDALTTDHHFEQAGFRALLRAPD